MKLKRFEILLPLNYNDGRPIERNRFLVTHREILDHFGATTIDAIQGFGTWKYLGTLYADRLIRIRVDSTEPDEAYLFFADVQGRLEGAIRAGGHLDHCP